MKLYSILAVVAVMCVIGSCKKDHLYPNQPGHSTSTPLALRKVHYELYTTENFSDDAKNIQFSIFIRNDRKTLLDSALATMRVKDIPDFAHRIIIETMVPANDPSTLTVGFIYHIENVGISWYLEPFRAGETEKELIYSFK